MDYHGDHLMRFGTITRIHVNFLISRVSLNVDGLHTDELWLVPQITAGSLALKGGISPSASSCFSLTDLFTIASYRAGFTRFESSGEQI